MRKCPAETKTILLMLTFNITETKQSWLFDHANFSLRKRSQLVLLCSISRPLWVERTRKVSIRSPLSWGTKNVTSQGESQGNHEVSTTLGSPLLLLQGARDMGTNKQFVGTLLMESLHFHNITCKFSWFWRILSLQLESKAVPYLFIHQVTFPLHILQIL